MEERPAGCSTRSSERWEAPLVCRRKSEEKPRAGKACAHSFRHDGEASSPNCVIFPTARQHSVPKHAVVDFGSQPHRIERLSVRKALAGKKLLVIGTTGFIGKVWLTMLLEDLPEIGRIYLLVRRQGSRSALQRFERIVAESPTFKVLHERHGDELGRWLSERIEVLEGDVSEPGLGLDSATAAKSLRGSRSGCELGRLDRFQPGPSTRSIHERR